MSETNRECPWSSGRAPAAPRLRVFHGDPTPPARSSPPSPERAGRPRFTPDTLLSAFFREWFVPHYCQSRRRPLKAATQREFATAVARWIVLIGDLPLRAITLDHCREFVEADLAAPGRKQATLSAYTVHKHAVALETIFRQGGPRTRETPDAATEEGLFGCDRYGRPRPAPWFPPIERPPLSGENAFELHEIRAWLDACEQARQPVLPECTPAQWWRALILFCYNSAMRIGAVLQLRRGMLRYADGQTWLDIPGEINKQGKPAEICLSQHAVAAIESLPTTDLIFPFPHGIRHLHTLRRELLAAAGLPEGRRFGFHALRKANANALYQESPEAAQAQLGHHYRATTEGSYVRKQTKAAAKARLVLPALNRLPQPTVACRQGRLFD